jgi:two-component system LytT family response regulator
MAIEKTEQLVVQENLDFQYKILLNNIKQNVIEKKRIVLKEVNTHHILQIDDIVMCVAQGSYTQFILESGESIIISRHLKEFEELLPNPTFFRVHRSYLINLDKIVKYERSDGGVLLLSGGQQIPVSVRKRESLTKMLSKL